MGWEMCIRDSGETQSDAKDLLRNTIVATVNKVYLDRYLEEYQKQREKAPDAVSYTHLDVYKRQSLHALLFNTKTQTEAYRTFPSR